MSRWRRSSSMLFTVTLISKVTLMLAQSALDEAIKIKDLFWREKANDFDMVDEVIPRLINGQINDMLIMLPTLEEVLYAVLSLNKESAPGHDDFDRKSLIFRLLWTKFVASLRRGKLNSCIAGRVLLVGTVIQRVLLHTMMIYSWPVSLLRFIERWSRNFIWSGDTDSRKLVTVAWKYCCKKKETGGLGLKSFVVLKEAAGLLNCWDFVNSQGQ
ncbi:unnamed protein product [Vicia faba]|uniref:Uncharacterized protein n=1 Tax=Vicia faba TaxID=3906 RepID=A0AAV1B5Z0_VICFA|nr:unnamed protein product [Vicia faba]